MTYRQQHAALKKLHRIVNTIQKDPHLWDILMSYTYVDDKLVKTNSEEHKAALLDHETYKTSVYTAHELIETYRAELADLKSKTDAFVRDEKIKTILKK